MNNSELENLISDINEYSRAQEEFLTTSQDSPYHDYVATFGYGEADPQEVIDRIEICADYDQDISREEIDQVVSILSKMEKSDLFYTLDQYASVERIQYYENVDSVFSINLGEHEEHLPDEILERLEALNNQDLQYVRKNIEEFLSSGNILYINLSGAIALAVDIESLVKDLLEKSKIKESI